MMILAYALLFLLTGRTLFKGFESTRDLMQSIIDESERVSLFWVKFMLGGTWFVMVFLILFARVRLDLPPAAALMLILFKLPSLYMVYRFFLTGQYTRAVFFTDKLDQWSNVALCFFAFSHYLL